MALLQVVPDGLLPPAVPMAAQASARLEAEAYLAGVERRLAAEGVRVHVIVRHGDASEEIRDTIETRRPDVVAMSTPGRTTLTRLLLGSVAEKVLRTSPVPILARPVRAHVWGEGLGRSRCGSSGGSVTRRLRGETSAYAAESGGQRA